MSVEKAGRPALTLLWRAFLLHAAVAGAFGLLTIFWGQPSVHVMSVAGGLYFLGLAAAVYFTEQSLLLEGAIPAWLTRTVPVFLAIAGLLNLWVHADQVFAQAGALALILMGLVYLIIWFRNHGAYIAARDFLLIGIVTTLTGVLLPLFRPLGAHALLGVAGGGAVISAVVLALAALSYRHDAREVPGPVTHAKPVN
ncbi:hypothetical protein P4U43_12255 [Arthrobacter sp. EH-1B-1]|uniref:Uncharacterized protein n=1 Tax=Arthrobacter vasquezii TaxID=2977629 RepID=A0ABT6CX19_9MICC|nr:hypothetical protein [Arthrobacter vasquezii]MDF9278559.1 hypothetical protein [Arthrobacter vasquezii]